jgi:repressor of nif and glnA expression
MSSNYSIILVWAKGAKQRRKILCEIYEAQQKEESMFVSKLAKIYENELGSNTTTKKISRSAIRKHVEILKKYNFIEPVNVGGKPEFLQLTELGLKAIKKFEENS